MLQEMSAKTKEAPLSGTELRNRSWGLINAARLDYSPKFISSLFNGKAAPIDGLIRTPRGYYRLAEDTRDGTRVLLHSYERGQLTGIERDDKVFLSGDADDVYGVTARSQTYGNVFRDDMNYDIRYLEKIFQKDLNLHAEEILIPTDNPEKPFRRKIKLANSQMAFGIMETDEGKWQIRVYNNLRGEWDDKARFVQVSSETDSKFKGTILNNGKFLKDRGSDSVREFDNLKDAIQYTRRFWKIESLKLFRGQPSMTQTPSRHYFGRLRDRLLSTALYVKDQKIDRDWRRAIAVSVGVGLLSTIVSGTPLIGAMTGLGYGLAWATFGKSIETVVSKVQDKVSRPADKALEEAMLPFFEQNSIDRYLEKTAQNANRFRKKLDPDESKYLRLLSLEEADMIYDDMVPSPPENEWRDFERLSSAAYRYFGSQFDASNDEHNILISAYPNGMISLTQVDKSTRATRHYVTYNEEFDLIGDHGKYKHLDPKLSQLPQQAEIHKITHRQGKDFRYAPMSCDEFKADLAFNIDPESGSEVVQAMKAFGLNISDVFNCTACDGIFPQAKPAIAVEDWVEKRKKGLADFFPILNRSKEEPATLGSTPAPS